MGEFVFANILVGTRYETLQIYLYTKRMTSGHLNAAIVATYSLHHLDDARKVALIRGLLPLLAPGGCLYLGDVAFETRAELDACRSQAGPAWDPDEVYVVYDELRAAFPALTFKRMSPCAGLLTLTAPDRAA